MAEEKISIVTPIYNEEGNIERFFSRLSDVLAQEKINYEIIAIDDGSSDSSFIKLLQLQEKDSHIKLIKLSRNFGHMTALSSGINNAEGSAVITIDSDLQHPPKLIHELIKKWREGYKIVNTKRISTKKSGIFKKAPSFLFYLIMKKILRVNIPENSAEYRLIDKQAVDYLKQIRERTRFLRGIVYWIGFKQCSINYEADERMSGKSKYSFPKMLALAIDGITSFSTSPLRISTYIGLFAATLSFIYIIYALYIRFFTTQAMVGWASVLIVVLFLGGIQLISIGIIGEYLGRVYEETKQRPLYIIDKKIGF